MPTPIPMLMPMLMKRLICGWTLFSMIAIAEPGLAAAEDLVGRWRGVSEMNRGEILEVHADGSGVDDGAPFRWTKTGKGKMQYMAEGLTIPIVYSIDGGILTVDAGGQSLRYQSLAKPDKPARKKNPLTKKTRDPFLRAFRGESIHLILKEVKQEVYQGELSVDGTLYPVQGKVRGSEFKGSFRFEQQEFSLSAKLDGDTLELDSEGNHYVLKGDPLPSPKSNPLADRNKKPKNPLAGKSSQGKSGKDSSSPAEKKSPPKLTKIYRGETAPYQHPRGWFQCELPKGWSVARDLEDSLLINPGLTATDTLDALIFLSYGFLEESERNQDVTDLMTKLAPELRQAFSMQGITLDAEVPKPMKVKVSDVPGAVLEWKGQAGPNRIRAWVGVLIKRDCYLSVSGILVEKHQDKFLPGVKRLFVSMNPKPPERNRKLEEALAGNSYFKSTFDDGGSFHSNLEFRSGGKVISSSYFSGQSLSFDTSVSTDDAGTYEVVGDQVYLYFEDGQQSYRVFLEANQIKGLGNATSITLNPR